MRVRYSTTVRRVSRSTHSKTLLVPETMLSEKSPFTSNPAPALVRKPCSSGAVPLSQRLARRICGLAVPPERAFRHAPKCWAAAEVVFQKPLPPTLHNWLNLQRSFRAFRIFQKDLVLEKVLSCASQFSNCLLDAKLVQDRPELINQPIVNDPVHQLV
jgi:hypothetical protein